MDCKECCTADLQPCTDECELYDCTDCEVQLQPCCDEVRECCEDVCYDACNDVNCVDWHPEDHYCCDIDHGDASVPPAHSFSDMCNLACATTEHHIPAQYRQTLPQEDTYTTSSTPISLDTNASEQVYMGDPYHCHWQACDLSFLDSLEFDQHFLTQHLPSGSLNYSTSSGGSPSSLMCAWDQCGAAPQSAPALFDHIKHDHVEVEHHYRCKWLVGHATGAIEPCGVCVSSASDLTKHIIEQHIGSRQKEYTCYWHGCDRCQRPFSQRQKITRHIVVHTGDRPFKCTLCDYACSEEAVLKQHLRTHTGEKPFVCNICHKSFSASTALSVHMRIHTGFKPLTCRFPGCGKRFSESSNLAKHERTHASIRNFPCTHPGCKKSFQRPDQLKRHLNSVHKGVHLMK